MMTVRKHKETGYAEIFYDDETLQGNQIGMRIDDRIGMELLAQLCDFYEAKGYRPLRMLNAVNRNRPGIFKWIAGFFSGGHDGADRKRPTGS